MLYYIVMYAPQEDGKCCLIVALTCFSLTANEFEHVFICYAFIVLPLLRNSYSYLLPIATFFVIFKNSFVRILYMLFIPNLCWFCVLQTHSSYLSIVHSLFNDLFSWSEVLYFNVVELSIFILWLVLLCLFLMSFSEVIKIFLILSFKSLWFCLKYVILQSTLKLHM